MLGAVARRPARTRPRTSVMAGLVGTAGMLAEASGCGAVLDVAAVPRPAGAALGDWLTCFPGFAMVTAERARRGAAAGRPGHVGARCGELDRRPGRRPALARRRGHRRASPARVTGLGTAHEPTATGHRRPPSRPPQPFGRDLDAAPRPRSAA